MSKTLLRALSCVVLAWSLACGGKAPSDEMLDLFAGANEPGSAASPPSGPRPKGSSREPTLREARIITELMSDAERVRGLRFTQRVPVHVEDRDRITAYVEGQIDDAELERSRLVYLSLGLLPEDLDVRELLLRLMGEQIVGYYDPEAKRFSVRDDVMRAFTRRGQEDEESEELSEARVVIVHELVHALQDQNLGLSRLIEIERDTDAENAFHALVEGDATLAMIGHALEQEEIPLHRLTSNPAQVRSFSEVVRRSPLAGTELEQAPAIVRVPLLSAYVDGLAFCASLHGSGGFRAIDRAYERPPRSTEQVLHPERYARGDEPVAVSLPELPELAAAGYEVVHEDTLGELEMGVYFAQGVAEEQALAAAEGWEAIGCASTGRKTQARRRCGSACGTPRPTPSRPSGAARAVQERTEAGLRARSEVLRRGKALLVMRNLGGELRALLRDGFSEAGLVHPSRMAGASLAH